MITPRHILGAALILSWAMLLSARCLAAMIYSTGIGRTYEVGLADIGRLLPVCAWAALVLGLMLCLRSGANLKPPHDGKPE